MLVFLFNKYERNLVTIFPQNEENCLRDVEIKSSKSVSVARDTKNFTENFEVKSFEELRIFMTKFVSLLYNFLNKVVIFSLITMIKREFLEYSFYCIEKYYR